MRGLSSVPPKCCIMSKRKVMNLISISGVSQSLVTGTGLLFVLFDPASSLHIFLPDAQKMPLPDINIFQRPLEAAIKNQW